MPKRGRSPADEVNLDDKRVKLNKTAVNDAMAQAINSVNVPAQESQVATVNGNQTDNAIEPVAAKSTAADFATVAPKTKVIKDATVKIEPTKAESIKSVSSHTSVEVLEDEVDYDDFDLDLELDLSSPSKETDPTDYSNDTSLLSNDDTKKVDSNNKTVTGAVENTDKVVIKIEESDDTDNIVIKIEESDDTAEISEVKETSEITSENNTAEDTAAATKAGEEQETTEKLASNKMKLQHAYEAWSWGVQNALHLHPELQTCLGLLEIHDSTTTSFEVNGFKFDVSLTFMGVVEEASVTEQEDAVGKLVVIKQETPEPTQGENTMQQEQTEQAQNTNQLTKLSTAKASKLNIDTAKPTQSLRNMAPLSAGPTSNQTFQRTPCRFGANCNRGDACVFDHTQAYTPPTAGMKKPCTFVNLDSGCSKGADCIFSHELEGVACGKAKLRTECPNYRCAYKHEDDGDGVMFASAAAKKEEELAKAKSEAEAEKAKRDAALEQAEREAQVAEQLLGGPRTPVVKAPVVKTPVVKTPITTPPAGPNNTGSLGKGAGQKRDRENDGDNDGDSDDYTENRPHKSNQTPQNRNMRQQNYQNGGYGYQQNGYGNQQYGYQYGNQYGNHYTGYQQYGNQQNSNQYNGYQQRNGNGNGNGARGRGRGRGNSRQNQHRNVTAQANAPQEELKNRGTAAQHNP